jgi:hypothetical protein
MGQTEFTGRIAEVTFDPGTGAITFEGLLNGTITETGKGATENLDVTVCSDSTYTTLADPLGPKGNATARAVITLQDSVNAFGDSKQTSIAFNDSGTLVVDMAKGTSNANTYTHTSMELVERVTTIRLDALAECVLTFEANAVGAWDSPA